MRKTIWLALVLGIIAVLLGMLGLVGGCVRPQEFAGIADTEIIFTEAGYVQKISNRSGREGEGLVLLVTQTDGTTVEIRADSVTGSDAIKSRQEMEAAIKAAGLEPGIELINTLLLMLPTGAGEVED